LAAVLTAARGARLGRPSRLFRVFILFLFKKDIGDGMPAD